MDLRILFTLTLFTTLILTALVCRFMIPKLKSIKMGQKILDIGPRWHKSKEGTPIMGGLSFIAGMVISLGAALAYAWYNGNLTEIAPVLICFGFALLNGLIGFIDDFSKFFKKQNEGLTVSQKYLLQLFAAGLFLFALRASGFIETRMYIPYFDIDMELGIFYYIIALILITGIVNSVNLTDGIDGLASSVSLVVGGFFAFVSFIAEKYDAALLSAALIGGCLGFLIYNFHPARIFMGDTGSLFLGGLVIALGFLVGNPLIVLVCGIIYIIETASVMLQVIYFKLTHGKRLFKMAPIHHHFEQCGWGEVKIVSIFCLITLAACAAAYFGMNL